MVVQCFFICLGVVAAVFIIAFAIYLEKTKP